MEEYAIRDGADWRLLLIGQPVRIDEDVTSYSTMAGSEAFRAEHGIERINDVPLPDGMVRVGESRLEDREGAPFRVWDLQDAPPPPAPAPIEMTIGFFVGRLTVPEYDDLDDAMQAEARLIKRLWNNDRHEMTEGDDLWTIIAGHLNEIVSAARKAELLSRPDANAGMAAPADEAMAA